MSATDDLSRFQERLNGLLGSVRRLTTDRVSSNAIRSQADAIGTEWFSTIKPHLTAIPDNTLSQYSKGFERLVKISAPNNRRSSYLETLTSLTKKFRAELILPLKTATVTVTGATSFDAMFAALGQSDEDQYLSEAIACAKHGFLRASAVLGWCAAIDRIHRTIETVGFTEFNVASARMASQQQGRFKRFNKPQNVASISELRMVFDNDLLWIIEGMQLIDSNQHTRLHSCFELRNHSGHPGEAPVTEYNLLSFFSDLIEIVLKNPRFN